MKETIDETKQRVFTVGVTIGKEGDGLDLGMHVVSKRYKIDEWETHFRYDEVEPEGPMYVKSGNWVRLVASRDPIKDRRVEVYHNGWILTGQYDKMVSVSRDITEYHCHNSLFRFVITINTQQG